MTPLSRSRALWNRSRFDSSSDEILAQILDHGEMRDWRELYELACRDGELRRRIRQIVLTVPIPLPHFWLAALRAAGDEVDFGVAIPSYDTGI